MAYIMENAMALAASGHGLDMTTITPPGASWLPWDTAKCQHLPGERCSGTRGCVVHPEVLGQWHAEFVPRLDAMMRASRERLRRMGHRMPRYLVVLEPQGRGALHVHIVTPVTERAAAAALATSLRVLAPRYGFGKRVGWDPSRGRDHANRRGVGAYLAKLAKYMAKEAAGESSGMRAVLESVPGRRVFRASTRLTGETRVTMRNLRLRRWAHARYDGTELGEVFDLHDCREVERLWAAANAAREDQQRRTTMEQLAVSDAEVAFGLLNVPPPSAYALP